MAGVMTESNPASTATADSMWIGMESREEAFQINELMMKTSGQAAEGVVQNIQRITMKEAETKAVHMEMDGAHKDSARVKEVGEQVANMRVEMMTVVTGRDMMI